MFLLRRSTRNDGMFLHNGVASLRDRCVINVQVTDASQGKTSLQMDISIHV